MPGFGPFRLVCSQTAECGHQSSLIFRQKGDEIRFRGDALAAYLKRPIGGWQGMISRRVGGKVFERCAIRTNFFATV